MTLRPHLAMGLPFSSVPTARTECGYQGIGWRRKRQEGFLEWLRLLPASSPALCWPVAANPAVTVPAAWEDGTKGPTGPLRLNVVGSAGHPAKEPQWLRSVSIAVIDVVLTASGPPRTAKFVIVLVVVLSIPV